MRGLLFAVSVSLALAAAAASISTERALAGSADSIEANRDNSAVAQWFDQYDAIRCSAEMSFGDKLQVFNLRADKPNKRNAEIAARMVEKYSRAVSLMEALSAPAETKELHDGFAEYFRETKQLLADYLEAINRTPFRAQSFTEQRQAIEALNKRNKALDHALRNRYGIEKHRHRSVESQNLDATKGNL